MKPGQGGKEVGQKPSHPSSLVASFFFPLLLFAQFSRVWEPVFPRPFLDPNENEEFGASHKKLKSAF